MRSESGEITSSPDKGPLTLPNRPKPNFSLKIEDVLLSASGNSNVLAAYREALVNMKERYPRESLEWQQWMAGSKVWVSNCINLPTELDSGAYLLTQHQFVKGVPFPATSLLDHTYSALQMSITLTLYVLAVVVKIILEEGELVVAGKLKRRLVVVDLDRLRLN